MYARRRPRGRWVVGALILAIVVGGGVALAVLAPSWFRSSGGAPTASPTPSVTPCPSAQLAGGDRLGSVVWVDGGALHLLDLDTCDERTLVASGAAPPVRFSADGRWVAFGQGSFVPAAGGTVVPPAAGPLTTWAWSPSSDTLAGVTAKGGVVIVEPTQGPRVLLRDGSHAGHVAFAPDGRSLAVDLGGDRVAVVNVGGGPPRTIYRVSSGTKAPPQVSGWSPDGKWILFFSRFPGRGGIPLNAAPVSGGNWFNVFDPVLPYDDFVSWCGHRLVVAGGADQTPSAGDQILLSGPPDWRYHNLSNDFARSWFWPACSPDGRRIAATVTVNHTETPPGHGARSIWLVATDGSHRSRLTGSAKAAFELPRWSADGRFLLVVRRGVEPTAPGSLFLYRVDPAGKATKAKGAIARLGPAPGTDGRPDWSAVTDWYRPG